MLHQADTLIGIHVAAPIPPKRVYILEPFGGQYVQQIHQLRMLFMGDNLEVLKLSPSQKLQYGNCVIVVPDTGGINTNVEYFKNQTPFAYPAQDNGLEYWRLQLLHYFVRKGIPIIGLGTSSFLIFAEVCKGNLMYGQDGLSYGASKLNVDMFANGFMGPKCGGLHNFHMNEDTLLFVDTFFRKWVPH